MSHEIKTGPILNSSLWCLAGALLVCSCREGHTNPELEGTTYYQRRFYRLVTNEFKADQLLSWGREVLATSNIPGGLVPRELWTQYMWGQSGQLARPAGINIVNDTNGHKWMVMVEFAGSFGLTGIAIIPSGGFPKETGRMEYIEWTNGVHVYFGR